MAKSLCGLLFFFFFIPAVHADLILNGDFETGDFTGWAQSGWLIDTLNLNSGVCDAATDCAGESCTTVGDANAAYLYQNVTASGTTYTLSFFYNSGELATTASELLVLWGDPSAPGLSTVADFVNVDTSGAYVKYTGAVTATLATSRLEFLGR